MLHPQDNIDLTMYDKKFKYDAKKEIAKIKQPYLRPHAFTFKIIKEDYFDISEKELENP